MRARGARAVEAEAAVTEWLDLGDGMVRRVVTIGDELLPPDAAARASAPKCACGQPTTHGSRSCGAAECVARLWESA